MVVSDLVFIMYFIYESCKGPAGSIGIWVMEKSHGKYHYIFLHRLVGEVDSTS